MILEAVGTAGCVGRLICASSALCAASSAAQSPVGRGALVHARHFHNLVLIRKACGLALVYEQQLGFRVPDELFNVAPLDFWQIFVNGEGCYMGVFVCDGGSFSVDIVPRLPSQQSKARVRGED